MEIIAKMAWSWSLMNRKPLLRCTPDDASPASFDREFFGFPAIITPPSVMHETNTPTAKERA